MAEELTPIDIGCEPSPSVPAETIIENPDTGTHLLFFAVSQSVGESGSLEDLGVAVVRFDRCAVVRYGYPNDEGRPDHPLWNQGLAEADSAVFEVTNSEWVSETQALQELSRDRIWGGRGHDTARQELTPLRHFLFAMKEMVFEAAAVGYEVTYAQDWQSAVQRVVSSTSPD